MNSITLYRVPWTYASVEQPYFKSDSSRDSYFAGLDKLAVNTDSPNIKVDYNYEISIKIGVDITTAEVYNFVIINYNNKNYYCDIIDYSHISIGYTRLEVRRNVLCEKTDYFKYFDNFMITRATFSDFRYNSDSKIFLPTSMRKRKLIRYPNFVYHGYNGSSGRISTVPMLILYFNNVSELPNIVTTLHGEPVQYNMALIPLLSGYYKVSNGMALPSKTNIREFLDFMSPNIVSLHYVKFQLGGDGTPLEPYILPGECYTKVVSFPEGSLTLFTVNSIGHPMEERLVFEFEGLINNVHDTHEYRIYSQDNVISLDLSRYCNADKIKYTITFYYMFSINSTEIMVRVNSDGNTIEPYDMYAITNSFVLQDTTHFTVNQEALWNSENKYYDAMTKQSMMHRGIKGGISAAENFAIGAVQIAAGVGQTASIVMAGKGTNNVVMGAGNIIRGIAEVGHTINDVYNIYKERSLLAANEREKPSETTTGNSANIKGFVQDGKIVQVVYTPFKEDLASFNAMREVYGVETSINREKITLNEFSVNNKFFIQATASKSMDYILTTREYNEMLKFLKGGSRYFIV